jgi:hypothetical protein
VSISFRIGAWAWIVCGLGHTSLDVLSRVKPSGSTKVDDFLRTQQFLLGGQERTYYEVFMGISIMMGLAIALVGALLLFVSRLPLPATQARQLTLIAFVASLTGLGISIACEPWPAIFVIGRANLPDYGL